MSDAAELQRVLAGADVPGDCERADRVRLLGEFAEAVIAGREPSREAALFVAGGIHAWLLEGGDLRRDYWRTAAPQGSNATETAIWRRALLEALREARQPAAPRRKIAASSRPKGTR